MNSFLFTAMALCLAVQCALAQYQATGYGANQQRKLAPSPQTYGSQSAGYGAELSGYEPQVASHSYSQEQPAYRAPSSAALSQYDERTPAASYQKPAGQTYARAAAAAPTSGYAQASSYAKPAAKYEEPYYPPMPFAWGYDINDGYGGAQYHKENGDEYGKRTGSYGYTDAYGIYRQVDYVADENGFRATIKTNEPGTSNESPADVELHAYEPPSNYYAGSQASYTGNQGSYAAASPGKSYAAPAYSAPAYPTQRPAPYPQPQRAAYSAPKAQYSAPAYSAPRAGYEPAGQYASSSVVQPVYQKAGKPLAGAPARRY